MLTGHGASIDTTFPGGSLVFGSFAALADFERELIIESAQSGHGRRQRPLPQWWQALYDGPLQGAPSRGFHEPT